MKVIIEAIARALTLQAADLAGGFRNITRSSGVKAPPRSTWVIRPYSRSKYCPHTAGPESKEAARRRRQIAAGMIQVSESWERKDFGRVVKPHRSGGGYARDGYRMAS